MKRKLNIMNRIYDRKWEKKRNYILRFYNYRCQESKRYGTTEEATTVHHIYPVEFYPELKFVDWNLLPVTSKAHGTFHKRESHELTTKGLYWQKKRRREFRAWMKNKENEL